MVNLKAHYPMIGGSSSASPRPWIELPQDVTENILRRLWPVEILENAQKVCTTWRSVCTEPSLWRVIDIKNSGDDVMCRRVVDRSQGELIDINIEYSGTDDLMHYISERSSRLKRLRLRNCDKISGKGLTAAVKNFPELEELHILFMPRITAEHIKAISISCPNLKSFTFNKRRYMESPVDDSYALTIAKYMPNLRHLCLFGNRMSNEGLKAIFNGCPNLDLLDLRRCEHVNLGGDFGSVCSDRVKYLKRPSDPIDDYELDYIVYAADPYGGPHPVYM
ncbi:hypothetical protein CASFOL_037050 [Castilleja foliolosa]|uniref:F-box domain-containing protein n=1 Tax=Castilleja foliolosa TaxID=1961234 RepID=A0ABD3BS00_9LAMI